jgi:acyl-coenzyme A synthetase/AMP-(fatty) acid ligase
MITQLIFDWAKLTPDRPAVIFNGRTWSYRSFAKLIAVARGYFARRGYVGAGYAVLAVQNLMDFWMLSLALRSLGLTTVVVPIAEEVSKLGLPNVRCVITNSAEGWSGLDRICNGLGVPLLLVSLDYEPALGLEALEASHPMGGHVLRTSGTTGTYKMLLMSADSDAALPRQRVAFFGLNHETVFCVFHLEAYTGAGYGWPVSTWTVGGAVVIEQGREPYHALLRPGITHAMLVPSFLVAILAAPTGSFPRNDAMRLAVTGGAISRAQIDQAKARITGRLLNYLGSTETGGIALTPLDTPEDHKWHRLVSGRKVEVVDEYDSPVPIGEVGRLRVSTEGGPTSYLQDETATRDFFRNGFFYPGDLAVVRSDGRMALQGRVTEIINIRGLKISPAHIEARLGELLGVSGVCLSSIQDDSGQEEVHAVIETPTPIDFECLSAAFSQELHGFDQVHYHFVKALPRNEMGKVLRQAVRANLTARRWPD